MSVEFFKVHVLDVKAETAKALLCIIADATGTQSCEVWVSKSQVAYYSKVQHRDDCGRLVVTRWWARKAGLIESWDDEAYREDHDYQEDMPARAAPAVIELTEAAKTYRRLALEHYPERTGGGGTTMKALNVLWDAAHADCERARQSS
jgi:hypothetical protein